MLIGQLGRAALPTESSPTVVQAESIFDPRVLDRQRLPLRCPTKALVTFDAPRGSAQQQAVAVLEWGAGGFRTRLQCFVRPGYVFPLSGDWFRVSFPGPLGEPFAAFISEGVTSQPVIIREVNNATINAGVTLPAFIFGSGTPNVAMTSYVAEFQVQRTPAVAFTVDVETSNGQIVVPNGAEMPWATYNGFNGSIDVTNNDAALAADFFLHVKLTL